MQMGENDVEKSLMKKSPVYHPFPVIVPAQNLAILHKEG